MPVVTSFGFEGTNVDAGDGTRTVQITITGLADAEAAALLQALYKPVQDTAIAVLTNGGKIQHVVVAEDGGPPSGKLS